jgi:cellobiose-specific phosphotransferase system component IIC
MATSDSKRWFLTVLLFGMIYFVVGAASSRFAAWAAANATRVSWNRLAFLTSGLAFAFHIGYEHFRLRKSPLVSASHVSLAVAVGALALALRANVHELSSASGYRPRMLIALIAWPLLTGVPAFIVALVVASGLNLRRAGTQLPPAG